MPLCKLGRHQPLRLRQEETEPQKDGGATGTLPHTRRIKKITGPETQRRQGKEQRPSSYWSAPASGPDL